MNFKMRYTIGNGSGLCPSIHRSVKCYVSPKQSPVKACYTTNGHTLTVADTAKYTGVSLHKHTSWSQHVHQAAKKTKTCAFLQHNLRWTPAAMKKWPIIEYSKCDMGTTHNGDNSGSERLYQYQCFSREGPSHHYVLDSSQPCLRPPHTGTHIQKSLFMHHKYIFCGTSMLSSLIV